MHLALINPNTSCKTTSVMVRLAQEAAGYGVTVRGHTAPFGVPLITTPEALDRATAAVCAMMPDLRGVDAVLVAAFGDPGVAALRKGLDVPVTGIAEAAMAEAAAEGRRFAVATTTPALVPRIDARARFLGHSGYIGTWTTPGDPAALTADAQALQAALGAAIETAVADGGAEAVIIGGGPLAMAARSLSLTAPVPLIEPIPAAVRLSAARARAGNLA